MKLQRYDIEPGSESIQAFPDGEYVKLSDVLALLDQIRVKNPYGWSIHDEYMRKAYAKGVFNLRARLRALIAAERGNG